MSLEWVTLPDSELTNDDLPAIRKLLIALSHYSIGIPKLPGDVFALHGIHTPGPWNARKSPGGGSHIHIAAHGIPVLADLPLQFTSLMEWNANGRVIAASWMVIPLLCAATSALDELERSDDDRIDPNIVDLLGKTVDLTLKALGIKE